jgi:hypothetical protein
MRTTTHPAPRRPRRPESAGKSTLAAALAGWASRPVRRTCRAPPSRSRPSTARPPLRGHARRRPRLDTATARAPSTPSRRGRRHRPAGPACHPPRRRPRRAAAGGRRPTRRRRRHPLGPRRGHVAARRPWPPWRRRPACRSCRSTPAPRCASRRAAVLADPGTFTTGPVLARVGWRIEPPRVPSSGAGSARCSAWRRCSPRGRRRLARRHAAAARRAGRRGLLAPAHRRPPSCPHPRPRRRRRLRARHDGAAAAGLGAAGRGGARAAPRAAARQRAARPLHHRGAPAVRPFGLTGRDLVRVVAGTGATSRRCSPPARARRAPATRPSPRSLRVGVQLPARRDARRAGRGAATRLVVPYLVVLLGGALVHARLVARSRGSTRSSSTWRCCRGAAFLTVPRWRTSGARPVRRSRT